MLAAELIRWVWTAGYGPGLRSSVRTGAHSKHACTPLPPLTLVLLISHRPRRAQVRLGTYYGKWSSAQVDCVVCWQPPPSDSAWQAGGAPPPTMPWETRQVVAFTTRGEISGAETLWEMRCTESCGLMVWGVGV